ncbi:MAG: abortive infection system antitoxin AbiGi family protein [Bacteroidota bacterium]|jgi:hypothetical protein
MPDYNRTTSVNISSNTLFHFTPSIDKVKGILAKGFIPHYCLENWQDGTIEFAIPMISFCDLPLFLIRSHLDFYGDRSYGLGLSKQWGMDHSVTPVLYVHKKTKLQYLFENLNATNPQEEEVRRELKDKLVDAVLTFVSHVKPYEGKLWRENAYREDIRFYNEREWRLVPNDIPSELRLLIKPDFLNKAKRETAEEQLALKSRLSFTPDDVKYIILKDDSEVPEMIDFIDRTFRDSRHESVEILKTCIITADVIAEDF